MQDPYITLEIKEQVSDQDVLNAYHRCIRKFTPESHPEKFSAIAEAYATLKTERDRTTYLLFGPVPRPEELDAFAGEPTPTRPSAERAMWSRNTQRLWLTRPPK